MRILFVYVGLSQLGGIETLIRRLSERLTDLGHQVTILLQESSLDRSQDPALLQDVRRYARVLFVRGWFPNAPASLRTLNLGEFEHIYAFESNSLLLSIVVQSEFATSARLAFGVYYPREYCSRRRIKRYQQRLVEDVMKVVPIQNVFFMNEANAHEHAECLARDFRESPVVPLAIDLERFRTAKRSANRRKIVSVGRITDFKTYNFWMLDVIHTLNSVEERFEYHVFGTGELHAELARAVESNGLAGHVFLHGNVPYSQFEEAMADAFVFVGMGTSVIEAAACGVPALVAIESIRSPETYGFLHEMEGYNVGEYVPDTPTYDAANVIEALARLDESGYEKVCERSALSAAKFSINVIAERFVSALSETRQFSFRITPGMRLLDGFDLWLWRFLRLVGVKDPTTYRYLRISQ